MTNHIQRNPWLATRTRTGSEYDAPYAARAAAGIDDEDLTDETSDA